MTKHHATFNISWPKLIMMQLYINMKSPLKLIYIPCSLYQLIDQACEDIST